MKRNTWKKLLTALFTMCLLLGMLPAAFAAEYGQPDITPQTTMSELRANPSIVGSGLWTYSKEQKLQGAENLLGSQTLEQYVGSYVAQDCADGLNLLIRNYNDGVQIRYKLYSEEEIAEDSALNDAEIYYFPASTPDAKYALILSGNVLNRTAEVKECVSTAYQLHEMGYAAFVMRYRIFPDNEKNAPLNDVARAVEYITEHAQQFGVQAENYAVIGHSAGGHLTGLFGSEELGWKKYGVLKPGALILAYPIVQFAEAKPVYRLSVDLLNCGKFYYQYSVADMVTENYPPTYFWYGKNDTTLQMLCWQLQTPALHDALERSGVTYREVVYNNAPHGIGLGRGTEAEGWLQDAVAFWEEQTN